MKQRSQAILLILSAAFFFALMNLFVRLSGDLPTMQKSFFRNAVACLAALLVILRTKERPQLDGVKVKYLLIRSIAGTVGIICNFYAVDHMNLADASMLNKLSPFFAILLSFFLLKEKISKVELCLVVAAFCGALFVIKPTFSLEMAPAALGVLGGFGAGLAYTYVRRLGQLKVPGPFIVMFFSAFSSLITIPFLIFSFHPMTVRQVCLLLLAGCTAAVAQFCITAAYARAPAKDLAVFDYSQILFAALLGFFFLEQIPDVYSVLGYLIIIGAAAVKWWYGTRQAHPAAPSQS
jgi:drug/metabolite transporter (DMT)-like permease